MHTFSYCLLCIHMNEQKRNKLLSKKLNFSMRSSSVCQCVTILSFDKLVQNTSNGIHRYCICYEFIQIIQNLKNVNSKYKT